jgi:hypothetical protein
MYNDEKQQRKQAEMARRKARKEKRQFPTEAD